MSIPIILTFTLLFHSSISQLAGTLTPETHPKLSWKKCTTNGKCVLQSGGVTLDSDYRWLHSVVGQSDCQPNGKWNMTLCPDPKTCARNCAVEGVSKYEDYGIHTNGDALTLKMNTKNGGFGQRIYFIGEDENKYELFKLLNREFTFDVDMSKLPCGTNGALYFAEMDHDGGSSKYPGNKAGAKYGTGYCDAQCPKSGKFVWGEANMPVAGAKSAYGACCNEMDIWEANKVATAYTPHPCTKPGVYRCLGADCGDGDEKPSSVCDKPGCDFNAFRMGSQKFYGAGSDMSVDSDQKMTVVTQFVTKGNRDTDPLIDIRRLYVQGGKVVQQSQAALGGIKKYDSITDEFCVNRAKLFKEKKDEFIAHGGLTTMGESGARGMVLVFSLWDDSGDSAMQWLDGAHWPKDASVTDPGVARGTCDGKDSLPTIIHKKFPDTAVTFSNIRFGEIGSTYGPGA